MSFTNRKCDECLKEYSADNRNLQRGWGKCCSKSCSAKKREKSKPSYNLETVERNNRIRAGKMTSYDFLSLPPHRQSYLLDVAQISISKNTFSKLTQTQQINYNYKRFGVDAPSIVCGSGMIQGFTSEGYRIMDGIAYDEFDCPVYNYDNCKLEDDFGWDSHK